MSETLKTFFTLPFAILELVLTFLIWNFPFQKIRNTIKFSTRSRISTWKQCFLYVQIMFVLLFVWQFFPYVRKKLHTLGLFVFINNDKLWLILSRTFNWLLWLHTLLFQYESVIGIAESAATSRQFTIKQQFNKKHSFLIVIIVNFVLSSLRLEINFEQ